MPYPTNTTPVRLTALQLLRTVLGGLRKADGYFNDVQWCDILATSELNMGASLPAIAIVPDTANISQLWSCDIVDETLPVRVIAAVSQGPLQSAEFKHDASVLALEQLEADIRRAIGLDPGLGYSGGGDVFYAQAKNSATEAAGSSSEVSYIIIDVTLKYRYPVTDPTDAR